MVSKRKTRLRIRLCLLALAGLLSSSPPAYALQDSESEDVGSTKVIFAQTPEKVQ